MTNMNEVGFVDGLLERIDNWLCSHKRARNSIVLGSAAYTLSAGAFGIWHYANGYLPSPLGLSIMAGGGIIVVVAPSFRKRSADV